MDAKEELKASFARRIETASSIADIEASLSDIPLPASETDLGNADTFTLLHAGLEAAQSLLRDDPIRAESVIVRFLLPLCVQPVEEDKSRVGLDDNSFRKMLVRWIEQYPQRTMSSLRSRLLHKLCLWLETDPTKETVWTIGAIGFRSDDVLQALWSVVERNDAIGSAAAGTLAGLGLVDKWKRQLLDVVRRKTSSGTINEIFYAIQELASPETLDWLITLLPSPNADANSSSYLAFVLIGIVTRVADAKPDNSDLQQRIWATIRQYKKLATSSGQTAGRCNTPNTVLDYFAWLNDASGSNSAGWRYIAYDRLSELVRPAQLAGWDNVPRKEVLDIVKRDCCANTGMQGRFTTTEFRLKQSAWETALSLGFTEAFYWLDEAVGNESNPYAQHAILELVACVRIPFLPRVVDVLIRDVTDVSRTGDMSAFFSRSGAMTLAWSANTREAFDAMLDCGLTVDGSILRLTSDALGELAVACLQRGDTDIIDTLFARTLHEWSGERRGLAIDAIAQVARHGLLSADHLDPLLLLAADSSLAEYSRCKAIEAISHLKSTPHNVLKAGLLPLVNQGSEIAWRVLEAFLRCNLLDDDVQSLLNERIQIETAREPGFINDGGKLGGWQGYVIGLLYRNDPVAFAPIVADALRRTNSDTGSQLYPAIVSQRDQPQRIVVDALIERILTRYCSSYIETGPLEALALLNAERLLAVDWHKHWSKWMPDGRALWCDVLCELGPNIIGEQARAITLLSVLAQDANFAVRRSAFRALASIAPEALFAISQEWSKAESELMRVRAAEAATLLPSRLYNEEAILSLELSHDSSRVVRESAVSILRDRRNRDWAELYVEIISKVGVPGGNDVIDVYRYGRALERLGDDWTVRKLRDHLRKTPLPRHVVYWISQIVDAIEKRWRQDVLNWREPSFGWEGAIEEIDGAICDPKGNDIPVRFSLWKRSRANPTEIGEWGGVGHPAQTPDWVPWLAYDEAEVRIPARNSARALIALTSIPAGGNLFILHGNSDYPEPEQPTG